MSEGFEMDETTQRPDPAGAAWAERQAEESSLAGAVMGAKRARIHISEPTNPY